VVPLLDLRRKNIFNAVLLDETFLRGNSNPVARPAVATDFLPNFSACLFWPSAASNSRTTGQAFISLDVTSLNPFRNLFYQ